MRVEPQHHLSLDDYESVAHLGVAVGDLRKEAASLVPALANRRVWMVSSTSRGGGVAELLPPLLSLLRDLGVAADWLVLDTDEPEFFEFTKRLHNLVHGEGDPAGLQDAEVYRRVSTETADQLASHLADGDVLVVHDPQPLAAGALLRQRMDITAIWRCHIGLDRQNPATEAAWELMREYALAYDHTVFTAPAYIPGYLSGRASIIHPGIDPLSHKNRDLPIRKLVGILVDGGLVPAHGPVLTPPFPEPAQRLQPDGSWAPALRPEEIGLLFRPIITQVSRWDRLKGFVPLMAGFVALKAQLAAGTTQDDRYRRTLETVRLVLAGPDPAAVDDDPEGQRTLEEIRAAYGELTPAQQREIAVVRLPMDSAKHNALLVNALQRCSDIVVQNSLREGFGLTATEAMWKQVPVVGSRAAGLRQQIRPGVDGRLVGDSEDPAELAGVLGGLLRDTHRREAFGWAAQRRVHDEFLVLNQVRRWLEVIADTVGD